MEEGPKSVVASLLSAASGMLEGNELPWDEKQVSNYKGRVTIDKRMSSVTTVSRESATNDLMQKCGNRSPA